MTTEKHETTPNQFTEDFEALTRQLTTDQLRFIVARQEHNSDKDAALSIGVSPETVKNWKYGGAPIDEAVRLMALDGVIVASTMRRKSLAKAMAVKVKGLESKSERLRQGVATEIIEWEMGKAAQPVTGKGGGPVQTQAMPADFTALNDDELEQYILLSRKLAGG